MNAKGNDNKEIKCDPPVYAFDMNNFKETASLAPDMH